eukprot:PhF_6_TR26415/c0_g1_i1/m.38192/K07198/PRKAA, AMPK; 5'-AMP-activated protein kinase, catalytic alpha subunit
MNIGPYEFVDTLGRGSFGKVMLAKHSITGELVAIKMVPRSEIVAEKMGQKLRREVNVQRMFCHPHIIRLFEVIHTSQHMFLVMEYASGGELFECISHQGRLHEATARRLFQQLVCAVEYCHDRGVAHRDLKPENILLHNTDLKIADFGLSNNMRDGEFLRTSCGSPNYAAPEVIGGGLYSGAEADIWSCGVILFAMLVGRLPFDEDSLAVLFRRIKEGKYTIPSTVPAPAADLISRILVVDVMERYKLSQIKAHPWFQEGLPAYLRVNPSDLPQLDDSTVTLVAKKFDTDVLSMKRLLQQVNKDQDIIDEATEEEATGKTLTPHSALVSYNIMLNVKNLFLQFATANRPQEVLTLSTPPLTSVGELATPHGSTLENIGNAMGGFTLPETPPSSSPVTVLGSGNYNAQWHFGLPIVMTPNACMAVVFNMLKSFDHTEWRVVAPYFLAVRSHVFPSCVVSIQLLKPLLGESASMQSVVVDFAVTQGNPLIGLDFAHTLYNALGELSNSSVLNKQRSSSYNGNGSFGM